MTEGAGEVKLTHAMNLVEPEAVELMSADREDVEAIAQLSMAISLKRIADTLDGTAAGICVTETIFGRQALERQP